MHYVVKETDMSPPIPIGQSAWRRSTLAEDLGDCFIDQLTLDDGLTMVHAQYSARCDLSDNRTMARTYRALSLTIALEGRTSTTTADGQRFDFIAGHSTVAAVARSRGERRIPGRQCVRQLRLIAEEPLLHRYGLASALDGVGGYQSAHALFFGKSNAVTQRLASSLEHLRRNNGSLLDLQIAALSLLSEHTRAFGPPRTTTDKLRPTDQDKMLAARDIMLRQFDRPLTVAYLCTLVGTNEFKLKEGFRELFGTSPHRMLTEIRMRKAWELLEGGLYVSTVAYKVGYQHLSSFSAAFERYYGRTPKSIAKALTSRPC